FLMTTCRHVLIATYNFFYSISSFFFFFNDTATTEIYTLSLHDALPICSAAWSRTAGRASPRSPANCAGCRERSFSAVPLGSDIGDRKSTRLNSSHVEISYAVFCLKKKKSDKDTTTSQKRKQFTTPIHRS